MTTSNAEYGRTIRMLRDCGQGRKYRHVLGGFNYRIEGLRGAILRVKFRHLDQWTEARRAAASKERTKHWNGFSRRYGFHSQGDKVRSLALTIRAARQ